MEKEKSKLDLLVDELSFCKNLMDRLVEDAKKTRVYAGSIEYRTRICNDIVRLRRELNTVRGRLERS